MINKINNLTSQDELKMIFDYSRVIELLFDTHLKMSSKIHNHLINFYYNYLFSVNLKYAYLIIFLYFENRHFFVFSISNIEQIQFI